MTLNEYLGIDCYNKKKDGTVMTHEEKYEALVNAIGYEGLKMCLPSNAELLVKEYRKGNYYFNSIPAIPLTTWDSCTTRIPYENIGVTYRSLAEGVCILKTCARMYCEELLQKKEE